MAMWLFTTLTLLSSSAGTSHEAWTTRSDRSQAPLLADTAEIKTISDAGNGPHKTAFYPIIAAQYEGKPVMNLFATRGEEYHSRDNRSVVHTYSMATLSHLEFKIDHVSRLFIRILRERFAETGHVVDLGKWLQWYAFDVIRNLTLSRTFGFLEEQRDVDNTTAAISGFMAYASTISQIAWLPLLLVLLPDIEKFNPAVMFAGKALKDVQDQEFDTAEVGHDDCLTRFRKVAKSGSRGGLQGGPFGASDVVNHTSSDVLAEGIQQSLHFGRSFMAYARIPWHMPNYRKRLTSMIQKTSYPIQSLK
ncbi:uncharacterized protein A1O9_07721 [Exophiala aquamarina CBS 119918]|uniref:Uncharacterized protein n=1 Tax=Exophiala aquamarina CBS 119918 TaxID=1182545 RepID=A0A072PKU6_9EURO|nr:uncharacterized protein A1O9_07721 [Exophiala aquamarina CBS 119918]KEF56140.1 hypothetical protein A1O9_07721 [Exophiala aquamarina CBS 119918]